jgi:hypothetical protein
MREIAAEIRIYQNVAVMIWIITRGNRGAYVGFIFEQPYL